MLPFLSSIRTSLLIGGTAMLLLVGLAIWSYWHWSTGQITTLNQKLTAVQQQAATLTQANVALQSQFARIEQAQDALNKAVESARSQAATAAAAIRHQDLTGMAKTDPRALQAAVNARIAQLLQSLRDLSHAS